MQTLPVSEYKNHSELWKFSVVVSDDGQTATIYDLPGDVLPADSDLPGAPPLPDLTLQDVLALLVNQGIVGQDAIMATQQQKATLNGAAIPIQAGPVQPAPPIKAPAI
jgi:hypothetical protein